MRHRSSLSPLVLVLVLAGCSGPAQRGSDAGEAVAPACTPCDGGLACGCTSNPGGSCRLGTRACPASGPSCEDAAPAAAGISCGTDAVCDGDGGCLPCAEGRPCGSNPSRCLAGVTSCASGRQTCADTEVTLDAGAACGAGLVCDGSGHCACATGYRLGTAGCVDIDECAEASPCLATSEVCRDLEGSYACDCQSWLVRTAQGCSSPPRQYLFPYAPGRGVAPRVKVVVDPLSASDVGPLSGSPYSAFSSVTDVFGGSDPALRDRFRSDFATHANFALVRQHPACAVAASPNAIISGYLKPYAVLQGDYLAWLAANHPGRSDFVPAQARALNPWRENQRCPLLAPGEVADDQRSRESLGQTLRATSDVVELNLDNRFNPMRWMAPINAVHHHEQPAIAFEVVPTAADAAESQRVMMAHFNGDFSRRILLEYDLEVSVDDASAELGETSVWGLYRGVHPSSATDIVGRTHWNTHLYATAGQSAASGASLTAVERALYDRYFAARFVDPSFQISLATVFQANGIVWRDAEFMLASWNYGASHLYPPTAGDPGFLPTGNEQMNAPEVTPEGGTSGRVGWHRMRIDALRQASVAAPQFAPILEGGEYVAMPGPTWTGRLRGLIDLTRYYLLARSQSFFPGQLGYWNGQWVGFDSTDPASRNPAEEHGVHGAFVVFEAHGALRTSVKVHRFDIWIQ